MSYPDPVYLGENGEFSAVYRMGSQAPELPMKTANASYLATGASTHGQFGLYRWDFKGPVSGPDPHFHRGITESFYILDGAVRLFNGKDWIEGTKGDFLYVPEGGVHAFRNESGEAASMLILFTPGAPREGYFEGIAAGLGHLTDEERAAFMLQHDTFWL
jgi:mannose-6-phosphate isomerase-like protein (cupin superfamily)